MTKDKMFVVLQGVVFLGLLACVLVGRDGKIADALIAIGGSLVGTGIYAQAKK